MEIPIEPPCTPTPFPFIHMWSWAIIFGHKLRDLALSHESWCGAHTLPCSLTHAKTHTCIQFFSFTYTLSLSLSLCLHIHTLSLIRSSCTLSVCEAPYLGIYSHTLSLFLCHSIKHLERDQSINDVSIDKAYYVTINTIKSLGPMKGEMHQKILWICEMIDFRKRAIPVSIPLSFSFPYEL